MNFNNLTEISVVSIIAVSQRTQHTQFVGVRQQDGDDTVKQNTHNEMSIMKKQHNKINESNKQAMGTKRRRR